MTSIIVTIACSLLSASVAIGVCAFNSHKQEARYVQQFRDTVKEVQSQQQTAIAVMQSQIKALTDEVRKHNNFAQRMPVVEEQIKVINHRIADLEGGRVS